MPPKKKADTPGQGAKQQALLSKFFSPTALKSASPASACTPAPATAAKRARDDELDEGPREVMPDSPRPQKQRQIHPKQLKEAAPAPNIKPDIKRAAKVRKVLDPPPSPPQQQASTNQTAQPKYTPLESQFLEVKKQHPGVILLVEVGYKFRLFGQDAEVAAQACNIYVHLDHNFMTASFPVYRLPVYTRRLVNAGHKVGVIRQVESAALKAQSATRSAPFVRQLTALYTAATLDAAQKADKIGEEGSLEEFAELDDAASNGGSGQPRYILFVAEHAQADSGSSGGSAAEEEGAQGDHEAGGHANGDAGSGGDQVTLRDECDNDDTMADASGSLGEQDPEEEEDGEWPKKLRRGSGTGGKGGGKGSSSKGGKGRGGGSQAKAKRPGVVGEVALVAVEPSTGDVQQGMCSVGMSGCELEAALIALAPAELVVVPCLRKSTMRLLQAYASSSPGCRVDEVSPTAASPGSGPLLKGTGKKASPEQQEEQRVALLTDMFAGDDASLHALLSLPPPVLKALAAAATHLSSFGLEAVLRAKVATGGGNNSEGQQAQLFRELSFRQGMRLTANAMRQLEVLAAGPPPGNNAGSLLHLLDRTHTPTGSRLLREWVACPLTELPAIHARLDAVEELAAGTRGPGPLSRLSGALRHLPDVEHGLLRALHSTAPPAEFVGTIQALQEVPSKLGFELDPISGQVTGFLANPLKLVRGSPSKALQQSSQQAAGAEDGEEPIANVVSPLLTRMLRAVASVGVQRTCRELLGALDTKAARENRTIDLFINRERFQEVFERRDDVSNATAKLKGLLPAIAKELGVRALDYVTIQNQGEWLIEVPKDLVHKVPRSWQQICATQKVTRYHPPAVRDAINDLLVAKERLAAAASAAWCSFLKNDFGVQHFAQLKAAATAISHLDALSSLAAVSKSPNYSRPVFAALGSPSKLVIRGGRHPMLEAQLAGSKGASTAVPNDLELRSDGVRAAVITGPNMGGKSCLIRQAALTVIMAQIGSYVPAESCELTVCDGVYTRMGASDNLLLGRSTFLEELSDAADTLAHATSHSLVIMDELGRGTATHDGVAIAQATLTHLVHNTSCLSLFVTHYPEVAQLEDSAVRAFHMAYLKCDDEEVHADEEAKGQADQQQQDQGLRGSGIEDNSGIDGSQQQQSSTPSNNLQTEAAHVEASPSGTAGTYGAASEGREGGGTGPAAASTAAAAGATRITFLYRLQEGAADASFGLNVAAMAGLPKPVVQQAALRAYELRRATEKGKEALHRGRSGSTAAEDTAETMDLEVGVGSEDIKQHLPYVVDAIRRVTIGNKQQAGERIEALQELRSLQQMLHGAQQ